MKDILWIGLDADDTLWHNESIFEKVHERYRSLLAGYHDAETVDRHLLGVEKQNIELYGYGIKGFTLSSIETAIAVSGGKISAEEIQKIIDEGKDMLAHPVELLDGVEETLPLLAKQFPLILITKGDLRDQERKLAKSRLTPYFSAVEIVSEKDESTYAGILKKHGIAPEHFVMVGNSLKSDILPILKLGSVGIYIPYAITWEHERVSEEPAAGPKYRRLRSLRELPGLLQSLPSAH